MVNTCVKKYQDSESETKIVKIRLFLETDFPRDNLFINCKQFFRDFPAIFRNFNIS